MNVEELKQNAKELIEELGPGKMTEAISKHLSFCLANSDKLDAGAKQYVDEMFKHLDDFCEQAYKVNEERPDSVEKRVIRRLYLRAKGKHYEPKDLLRNLEVNAREGEIYADAVLVFEAALRPVLNYLCDLSKEDLDLKKAILITLAYACAEELTTAFFLAQRNQLVQSFSHSRTALEILDKMKLFTVKPEMLLEWWINEDPKKIWYKYRPGKVRKMLGKETQDPIYDLLSRAGVHGNMDYLRYKLRGEINFDKKLVTLNIRVGSSFADKDEPVTVHLPCLGGCFLLLSRMTEAFKSHLLVNEVRADAKTAVGLMREFVKKHVRLATGDNEDFSLDAIDKMGL